MEDKQTAQIKDARSTLQSINELSQLLGTGLDPEALATCVRLCEAGVNPEVLAALVKELQKEVQEYRQNSHS